MCHHYPIDERLREFEGETEEEPDRESDVEEETGRAPTPTADD